MFDGIFVFNVFLFKLLFLVFCLLSLNILAAIALSIKDHEFMIVKLPEFIKTDIAGYFLGLLVLILAAQIDFTALFGNEEFGNLAGNIFVGFAKTAIFAYGITLFTAFLAKINSIFGTNFIVGQWESLKGGK